MKSYLITLSTLLLLVSCGGDDSIEAKKKLLETKKTELSILSAEIADLEKVLSESDSTFGATTDFGVLVGVKVLAPETFQHFFEVNGNIEAVEMANVSPEQGGLIQRITVKEGDLVKKGQVLAVFNTEVYQKNMDEIESALELSQTVFQRQSKLWEQKIGSEIQFLQAKNQVESLEKKKKTLQAQMAMSTIKAPFDGVVDAVNQKEGELAAPGMPLLTVVNMGQMKVKADVSENYAKSIRNGQNIEVNFPSFGMKTNAPISNVGSIINSANRSFTVEVRVNNSDRLLKPNGVATLRIKDFEVKEALVVPAITVGKDANGTFVFVVNSESKAVKTYVTTDRSSDGQTLITSGLKAGDRVVVEGYNEVANGNLVQVQG